MSFDFKNVKFEKVSCPICNSQKKLRNVFSAPDRINNLPGIFSVQECTQCGMVIQNPRVKEEFIKHYYPETMNYLNTKTETKSDFALWVEKNIFINFFDYFNLGRKNFLKKIILLPAYIYLYRHQSIPKYKDNGNLLEIGCSTGVRLKRLQDYGWNTQGVEMSERASHLAKKENGLNVVTGSIDDFDFKPESFDVIIMDMVLEHLYNPLSVIEKISNWLKKDGELIFSIPYFHGTEFKIFKQHTYTLHLPNHIVFFNKKSLRAILKNKFSDTKFIFQHFDRDFVASAHYKFIETNSIVYKIISQNKPLRWLIIKPLVLLLSFVGKTSRVTVFAKKK
jgi:2-polyprenyl-3-methyl-5-hydroxy-6-metoxy-1,4-benzoquinol methylase